MRTAMLCVALGLLAGCSLFENHPDRTCKSDSDCFVAQGEHCNTTTKECEAGPDAGTTVAPDDPAGDPTGGAEEVSP